MAVGFGVALWSSGIMGAIETVEAFAHIASYIRIMAVGLVGAYLADAANGLAFETMPGAVGLIIALILHVLNFVIICFSPTIHALRLNFLEFFNNFWQGGKVTYKPFVNTGKEGLS
jgi:V/A-type H+-transporting ATPase subunit I